MPRWHDAGVGNRATAAIEPCCECPPIPALITAVTLSRLANSMSQVGVVIYLLDATHSPVVAGAGAAAQLLPGIAAGPFVGAWLDRTEAPCGGDRGGAAGTGGAAGGRGRGRRASGRRTGRPLPGAAGGHRLSRFPILTAGLPRARPAARAAPAVGSANAADSVSFDTAYILGPALAGATVTLLRGPPTRSSLQALATLVAAGAAPRARARRPVAERAARCRRPGRGSGSWPGTRSCGPLWPR